MAIANEDGSIVLSTKVDTSGIDSFLKKINQQAQNILDKGNKVAKTLNQITTEIKRAENSESKRLLNAEKLKQEQEKTAILEQKKLVQLQKAEQEQIKINVLKEKENKAIYDSLAAESRVVVAEEKITAQKKQTEIAEQKKIQAQEKTKQIAEATKQAEEKTEQAVYKTLKAEEQVYQAQEKTKQEVEKTKQAQEKTTEEILRSKNAQNALHNISKKLSGVLSSVAANLALAFSVTKIIQFSKEAGQLSTQTEASIQRLVDIYGSASDSVGDFIDANARALGMSKAAAASFSSVYGNLFSVWADQATNAELTNRYLNMTAVVASKTGRTVEDVQERVRSGLLGNTEAIEDLGIFVNVKTIEMTYAFQRMANGKSWEQLDAYTQQQIRSMAILEQATAKYGDEVADTSATVRNRYKAAYEDFKNSWGNIVNTVLLPVLETLTQIFDIATRGLNSLSGRGGQILENAELQEENTDKTAENIEEQTKNQKELNKEIKKSLAGFDDIQIVSGNTAENLDNEKTTQHLNLENIVSKPFSNEVNGELQAIMAVVGGALVAVGLVLLYFGQISYGIGFIIAGAAEFAVTAASIKTGIPEELWAFLSVMAFVISDLLVVIGIILIATGVGVPLGIGFILAGASGMVSTVALNWSSISNIFDNIVEKCKTSILFGVGLVVLGILLLAIAPPLGVGLILAGAGSLAYQALAPNWDFISDKIKEMWDKAVNVWNSDVKPGIDEVGRAWEELYKDHLAPVLKWIEENALLPFLAFLKYVFLWALDEGIDNITDFLVVLFKFVGEILGGMAEVLNFLNFVFSISWSNVWEFIRDTFDSAWEKMVSVAKNQINTIIGLINSFISKINNIKIQFPTSQILGNLSGFSLGFNIPQIPRLAQGAVIPPNREFLAVLGDQKQGTNIEAPLQTIVDAFNIALSKNVGYNGGGNTEVVLEIDGREFGRAVVEQGNRENRRIGTRLVIA